MCKNTRGTQSQGSTLLLCRSGPKHTELRWDESVTLGAVGTLRNRWGNTRIFPHSVSRPVSPVSTPHTPPSLVDYTGEHFSLSPALSTPSAPHLCHPRLFSPCSVPPTRWFWRLSWAPWRLLVITCGACALHSCLALPTLHPGALIHLPLNWAQS